MAAPLPFHTARAGIRIPNESSVTMYGPLRTQRAPREQPPCVRCGKNRKAMEVSRRWPVNTSSL